MKYMPAKPTLLQDAELQLLSELGERLRKSRLRRKSTAATVAAGANITRVTLHRLERGEPAVTLGTLIKVMGVLGLAGDFSLLARDDKAGRLIQDEQLAPRRGTPAASRRVRRKSIRVERYPQLTQIAWHLDPATTELTPEEAFATYERNWRHIDQDAMNRSERALVKELIATVGKGVLLV